MQEMLSHLPINPEDEEDIVNYIKNITNLIAINYKYGQYQFAYFGAVSYTHLDVYKRQELDWLIYNDPLAYAELILNEESVGYLKRVTTNTVFDN